MLYDTITQEFLEAYKFQPVLLRKSSGDGWIVGDSLRSLTNGFYLISYSIDFVTSRRGNTQISGRIVYDGSEIAGSRSSFLMTDSEDSSIAVATLHCKGVIVDYKSNTPIQLECCSDRTDAYVGRPTPVLVDSPENGDPLVKLVITRVVN